jgi:S-(hydroxymethyl)glutathione dehydrogenase/alcohol dehydrogenase
MMNKAKAAILYELNQPLVIREIELPELLNGQVLVKIFYSGVCRSQLMEVRGNRGEDNWLPHLLGHEGAGEVIAVGKNVKKVVEGDKVILGWIKGEGQDAPGAKYLCDGKVINSGKVTTFSTYTIVSESRLVKSPKGLPMDIAVLFGCALLTGAGMVFNELKPDSEQSVAVIGLGGIGLSALMALTQFRCKKIIAIDISDERLAVAKSFGATDILNSSNQDVKSEILRITEEGVDACVESGGKAETIELGFSIIKKGTGKLFFASHPPEGQFIKLDPHELISGKQIFGSWGGGSFPDVDIPKMANIYFSGKFPLEQLLTKRYKLENINNALFDLENGKVFRPLIDMRLE